MGIFSRHKYTLTQVTTTPIYTTPILDYRVNCVTNALVSGNQIHDSLHSTTLMGAGSKLKQYYTNAVYSNYSYGFPICYTSYKNVNISDATLDYLKSYNSVDDKDSIIYVYTKSIDSLSLDFVMYNLLQSKYFFNSITNSFNYPSDYTGFKFNKPFSYLMFSFSNNESSKFTDGVIISSYDSENTLVQSTEISVLVNSKYLYDDKDANGSCIQYSYFVLRKINTTEKSEIRDTIATDKEGNTETQESKELSDGINIIKTTTTTSIKNSKTTVITKTETFESKELKYFIYSTRKNTILSLSHNSSVQLFETFPLLPVRLRDKNLCSKENLNTDEYKKLKNMGKYIGVDILTVANSIDSNTNINKIRNAWILPAVSLDNTTTEAKEYIYSFFSEVIHSLPKITGNWRRRIFTTGDVSGDAEHFRAGLIVPTHKIHFSSSPFFSSIMFESYDKTVHTGKICDVNKYVFKAESYEPFEAYIAYDYSSFWGKTYYRKFSGDDSVVALYKQVTETMYECIKFSGLTFASKSNGEDLLSCVTAYSALNSPTNNKFIVPLAYNIINKTSLVSLSQIAIANAFVMVHVTDVKEGAWYDNDFFARLLPWSQEVISIAIQINGAQNSIDFNSVSQSALENLFKTTLTNLIINLSIDLIIDYSSKHFGEVTTKRLSTVFSVYRTYSSSTNFNTTSSIFDAAELLKLIPAISKAVQDYLAFLNSQITKDMNSFNTSLKEREGKIKAAWEKLLPKAHLTLETLSKNYTKNIAEFPSDFFIRTLTTNPNSISLDNIGEYTNIMLDLKNI